MQEGKAPSHNIAHWHALHTRANLPYCWHANRHCCTNLVHTLRVPKHIEVTAKFECMNHSGRPHMSSGSRDPEGSKGHWGTSRQRYARPLRTVQ